MRSALVIAALEVRRRLRDRSLIIQGIIGPIVLAGVIGAAFGGGGGDGSPIVVELAVADEDASAISIASLDGLRAAVDDPDAGLPVVLFDQESAQDARNMVDRGRVDAAIVFPAGFGAAALAGEQADLVVYATSWRRFSGDIAEAVASQLAARIDTTRLAFATAAATGTDPGDAMPEPVLTITEESVGGDFDAITFFAPSMAILFLFFTVGAGARSLLRERSDGTLARVRAAPISDRSFLAGKALAVLASGSVSLAVVWGVTSLVFGASWGDPAGVALVLVAAVAAVAGVAAVLTGLARTEAQADSTTTAVAFILALVGGNFVSPGSLPPFFATLSRFTPNGWALDALIELSAGGAGAADVMPAVAVLGAMGLVGGALGTRLLRRTLA